MIVGIVAVLSLSFVQAKAQNPMDSSFTTDTAALLKTPVFSGNEKNKADSVLAIAKAAIDPETKDVLIEAGHQLQDTPKGGGIGDWIAYIIAALGVIYGLYQYFQARWRGDKTSTSS